MKFKNLLQMLNNGLLRSLMSIYIYISVVMSIWGQRRPDMRHITLITYQAHDGEAEFRLLQEIGMY